MSQPKPLIIPWLRDRIDSKQYPGVSWTNQEHTEFCIPWKHALRDDSSVDDSLIFKAWADVSSGRAHGDPSIWKRNFRSALRAKGFHMVTDNKNDRANPHKVFRWPEEAAATGGPPEGPREPEEPEPDLYQEPLPIQESQSGECFSVDHYFPADHLVFAAEISPDDNQDILMRCLDGLNIEPSEAHLVPVVLEESVLPGQQSTYTVMEGAVGGVEWPGTPVHPEHGAEGVAREQQMVEQLVNTVSTTMPGDAFNTHFRLAVYYRGAKVWEKLLENEAGFRLVYMPDLPQPAVDAQSGLSLVSLPRVGPVSDQQQARLTQRILDSLGDGLEVGVLGNVVYGWRRGHSQAFWSLCKFDQSRTPQEVSKTEPQQLYQTKDFITGLLEFIKGSGQSPPFSLFFCLGEKWPDPDNKPWEKKLIVVEVVLTALEVLKMVAVDGGASSLQSVELQMSLEESLQELLMELG